MESDDDEDDDSWYDRRREVDSDEEDLRYEDHRWEDPGDDGDQARPMRRTHSDGSGKRRGTFAPGHKKLGGRKRGTSNRKRVISIESVLGTAADLGFDQMGQDGVRGFLARMARQQPGQYVKLLKAVLEIELRTKRSGSR